MLVTGGTGSLGSELVTQLRVTFPQNEVLYPSRKELDLTSSTNVMRYIAETRPTHVFHLAARVYGIQGHLVYPTESYFENSLIDWNVFSALNNFPPNWIFYASSVASYGYPFHSLPLSENFWSYGNPHDSEYGYAMAKRQAINMLRLLHEIKGVKFVYGLITNLFGSGDKFLEDNGHVVVSLLEKAKLCKREDLSLEVWGDGTASRDFLSTYDASKIIVELMDADVGILNIASGQEIYIKEIAEHIISEFELNKGITFLKSNQGITKRYCSVEKLNSFSPHSLEIDSRRMLWDEISKVASNLN